MRRRKRRKKSGLPIVFLFLPLMTLIIFGVVSLDKKIFPYVTTVANIQAKNIINDSIYTSVNNIVSHHNLDSSDFYILNSDEQGIVNSLTVNTMLVNEICGKIAKDLSNKLVSMERQKINMPLGVMMGVESLANFGPTYSVVLIPLGNVHVDYETKFESVGINQINFQVWVHVDTSIRIVNPLQKSETEISRKISLVNTVFSGKVPDSFFNNIPISGGVK